MAGPKIPQSLQPQLATAPTKPPTVAEQRLIKQYGSVERGRAIQAQQAAITQPIIPEGYIGKEEISKQLSQIQNKLRELEIARNEEYQRLVASGDFGQSQQELFNEKWDLPRERLNRVSNALRNVRAEMGKGYVSQEAINQYVAGSVGDVRAELRQAELAATQRQQARQEASIYENVITKFGTTLSPQEIIQLTPSQARVVGVSKTDIEKAKSDIKSMQLAEKFGIPAQLSPEQIIKKPKTNGVGVIISGYDTFGQPLYQSVDVSKIKTEQPELSLIEKGQRLGQKYITEPISTIAGATIGRAIGWQGFDTFRQQTLETGEKITKWETSPKRQALLDKQWEEARKRAAKIGITYPKERPKPDVTGGELYSFVGGIGGEGLKFYKEKPLTIAGITAGGYAFSFLSGALVGGATAIGGATGGTIASGGLTLGGIGLLGYAGYRTAGEIAAAETPYDVGGVISRSGISLAHFGLGAKAGAKGWQQTRGWWATRGRTEVPLARLTTQDVISGKKSFPVAPAKTHKRLFESSVAGRYIEEGPGGFHTTPSIFYNRFLGGKKGIVGTPGTSELPGTYVSSYISPHFAKLSGEGGYTFSWSGVKGGSPGIAYIKPTGFREVGTTFTTPYQVGGTGKFFTRKFKAPAKKGIFDIPRIKTEIEAIMRPETGVYGFETGKFYTKIEGVRVPIDVFSYAGETIPGAGGVTGKVVPTTGKITPTTGGSIAGNVVTTGGVKLIGGASSYVYPSSTSLISPGLIGGGLISSRVSKKDYSTISSLTSISDVSSISPTSYISKPKTTSIISKVSKPSSIISERPRPPSSILRTPSKPSSYVKPSERPRPYMSFFFPGESSYAISGRDKRYAKKYGGGIRRDEPGLKEGWNVYGLKDATKTRKKRWIPLNSIPFASREMAMNKGAYAVDNSLSAQFRVVRAVKPKRVRGEEYPGYYQSNQQKFRNYLVRQGKKILLKNRFIEKSSGGQRLDTRGEINKIQIEKFKATKKQPSLNFGISSFRKPPKRAPPKPKRQPQPSFNMFGLNQPISKTKKNKRRRRFRL